MDSNVYVPNMNQGRKPGAYTREINNCKQSIGKLKRQIIYLEENKQRALVARETRAKEKKLLEEWRLERRKKYGVRDIDATDELLQSAHMDGR